MNFYRWLMTQRYREDAIGDLASDVYRDPDWPKQVNTWKRIKAALPREACDEARLALRQAWKEYSGNGDAQIGLIRDFDAVIDRLLSVEIPLELHNVIDCYCMSRRVSRKAVVTAILAQAFGYPLHL